MKKRILRSTISLIALLSFTHLSAQPTVWQQSFCYNGGNIRAHVMELDSIFANIPSEGTVVVHLDGSFTATPGDLMVLAASNYRGFSTMDGNVSLEVPSLTANARSFSHTRTYAVSPGIDSFFAVLLNMTDTSGAGTINICGSLTVEFFPTSGPILLSGGEAQFTGSIRGAPYEAIVTPVTIPDSGHVIVNFDGYCISDSGDLNTLAATDTTYWNVNNNDAVGAFDNKYDNGATISNTQIYSVGAGNETYYGIAQNYVDMGGDGIATIYGNLTTEFFPSAGTATANLDTIATPTYVNVRLAPVAFDSITINVADSGYALVVFDGNCSSTIGDQIQLAASNTKTLGLSDSSVTITNADDAFSYSGYYSACFSHSRLYLVAPGTHTFYALGQNYGDTAGTGSVAIYAALSVKYYPGVTATGIKNVQSAIGFEVYPNPANNVISVVLQGANSDKNVIELIDLTGRTLQRIECGSATSTDINLSSLAGGMYFIRVNGMVKQVVKE